MSIDETIPLRVAAALAYGRLVGRTRTMSARELNEQLDLVTTILAAAIPSQHRPAGQVSVAALFEAIETLLRESSISPAK